MVGIGNDACKRITSLKKYFTCCADKKQSFNRSRQPRNFAMYFPNHCHLLSMLNFN